MKISGLLFSLLLGLSGCTGLSKTISTDSGANLPHESRTDAYGDVTNSTMDVAQTLGANRSGDAQAARISLHFRGVPAPGVNEPDRAPSTRLTNRVCPRFSGWGQQRSSGSHPLLIARYSHAVTDRDDSGQVMTIREPPHHVPISAYPIPL